MVRHKQNIQNEFVTDHHGMVANDSYADPINIATFFVIRPFLFELFAVPTNPMAPSVVGVHAKEICSECGQEGFFTLEARARTNRPLSMICPNFHITQIPPPTVSNPPYWGDRVAVTKLLAPKRWDIIAFKFPQQPTEAYISRLIGLPGETIEIKEGSIWIDGKEISPPDSLQEISYADSIPIWPKKLWGSKNQPAVLGDDEYFVLGDFTTQSFDSRFWDKGAPNHKPYAVPQNLLIGVVTHTYWPPKRMQIHR